MSNLPVSVTAPPAVIARFPPTVVAPKVVAAALVVRSPVTLPDTPKCSHCGKLSGSGCGQGCDQVVRILQGCRSGGYGYGSTKLIGCIIQGHGLTSCGDSSGSSDVQLARVSYGTTGSGARFPATVVAPKVVAAALVVRSPVALPDTPKVPTAVSSVVPVVVKAATKLSASFKVVSSGGYGYGSTKLIGCIIQGHGLTSCGDSSGSSNVQLARVSYGTTGSNCKFPPTVVAPKVVAAALVVRSPVALQTLPRFPLR